MRHGLVAGGAALALALGGCVLGNPHNDVLVFGTTTKFALDVSAPVQNGAIPEFTLGYKRNEGVWMPLKANTFGDKYLANQEPFKSAIDTCVDLLRTSHGAQPNNRRPGGAEPPPFDEAGSKNACASRILPPEKYLAESEGIDSQKGGHLKETDTYSVFASFGGKGSLGGTAAAGSMAQFFATGIAAQRLGANPAVAAALNAGGDDAVKALADADAERARADAIIAGSAQAASRRELDALSAIKESWGTCADPATDNANFIAVLDEAGKRPGAGTWFTSGIIRTASTKDIALLILEASADPQKMVAFKDALFSKCPGT